MPDCHGGLELAWATIGTKLFEFAFERLPIVAISDAFAMLFLNQTSFQALLAPFDRSLHEWTLANDRGSYIWVLGRNLD